MLIFQEKIPSIRLEEGMPRRCDASFNATGIQVLSTREWVKSCLIVELAHQLTIYSSRIGSGQSR